MRKSMKRIRRPIVWALTVAFAVVLSADCATGKELTDAQKACCAAMNHDCGPMAKEQNCCSVGSQTVEQFTAAKHVSLAKPIAPVVLSTLVPDVRQPLPSLHRAHLDRVPLRLPDVPTYLLVSTFLI